MSPRRKMSLHFVSDDIFAALHAPAIGSCSHVMRLFVIKPVEPRGAKYKPRHEKHSLTRVKHAWGWGVSLQDQDTRTWQGDQPSRFCDAVCDSVCGGA